MDNGNLYLSYSTASNINGGESDVGGSCGYGGLCGTPQQVTLSAPERVENIELGTKWKLLDDRLLATAALFQITKSDVMESVGDAYDTLGTLNTGKNRVQGIEFALTGALTDKLSGQIGATFMNSEVLRSIDPDNEGLALANFADDSAFVQLRYEPTPAFAFGGTWTYQSQMYAGQPDSAAGYDESIGDYSVVVPSYDTFDVFVEWFATDSINVRLNVLNVADEEYWTAAYRSGSSEVVRSDLSLTLFLNDADDYDGGELVIEGQFGAQEVKLDAGDLVLYPSSSLHRVNPVTRGERMAAIAWLQSMVPDAAARSLLFDLDQSIQALGQDLPADHQQIRDLGAVYHNLVRRWARV